MTSKHIILTCCSNARWPTLFVASSMFLTKKIKRSMLFNAHKKLTWMKVGDHHEMRLDHKDGRRRSRLLNLVYSTAHAIVYSPSFLTSCYSVAIVE